MTNPTLSENKGESVDVKEYLSVLLKRKWLVLVCFLLSLACMTAFLFTRQPIYRASAKLLVSSVDALPVTDFVKENEYTFYSTVIELMQSQTMLKRVQTRMRKTPDEIREGLTSLSVLQVKRADIILVTVDSPSKVFAHDFANALCDEFIRFREEQRAKHQESALLTLTREIHRLDQDLKAANERILAFARLHNVAALESDPQLGQGEYLRSLQALNQAASDLANAQTRKLALDAQPDSAAIASLLADERSAIRATADNQPLGVGSVVKIEVDKAASLNLQATIGADGMLDFNPLGKIPVAGLTAGALASNIQQRLERELQVVTAVRVESAATALVTAGAVPQPTAPGEVSSGRVTDARAAGVGLRMLAILPEVRAERLYELETQRRELQGRFNEMLKNYRPKHPALQQAQKALEEVMTRIDGEVGFLRNRAEADLQMAKDRHQKLQASLDAVRNEAMKATEKRTELTMLREEADRIRTLYNTLLGALLKIDVVERGTKSVSILEYAVVENDPVYPKKVKGLLAAALVGLGLGLALAFFIEYIDDSIKLAEEVERDLQLPFLGMIPAVQWSPEDLTAHRLDKLKQHGGVAESYRVVRSAIIFSTPRDKLRSILLTSAVPREGKTTTCVNLSIGFAQIEERVLLIDADLRRGELHKYFGFEREKGLADVLLGEATPEQVIHHTNVPKLDVITTGAYPANPAELLLGWRLKETLDWAHKNYDRVIIDCPPVMGIADSSILGAAVDGVLFIIWAGRTSRRYVRVAKMTAVSRGAKIFGFVLNNLEPGRVGYYHYYPYYYSYYSRGYYYASKPEDKDKGGDLKGIDVPTPEGGEEKIDDVY